MHKFVKTMTFGGLMVLSSQAQAFENVRIDFGRVTALTSAMSETDRGPSESSEQQRIIITGIGSIKFDKSVQGLANKSNLRIRLNLPAGVSAKRRSGRNTELLSRAESGHASACLSFASRVLSNGKAFNLRVWSDVTGIAAGAYKRNKDADGRDILIVRINEDHFEDVRCTIKRDKK